MTPLPLLAALAVGQPDPPPAVSLPAEVAARPGRLLTLSADTKQPHVRWAVGSDDADLVPLPGTKSALFCSPKPGRYLVLAWAAAGDVPSDAARCVVAVADPRPGPPPGPNPEPTDPLAVELRRLVADDPGPDKLAHLAQLAAVYREAVGFADRAEVRTAGDLAARIRSAVAALLPADALTAVRRRVGEEIARTLPLDGEKPLEAATRQTAARLFARIATSLEAAR